MKAKPSKLKSLTNNLILYLLIEDNCFTECKKTWTESPNRKRLEILYLFWLVRHKSWTILLFMTNKLLFYIIRTRFEQLGLGFLFRLTLLIHVCMYLYLVEKLFVILWGVPMFYNLKGYLMNIHFGFHLLCSVNY